jgi:hypothetical protein
MAAKSSSRTEQVKGSKSDPAVSYKEFKEYEGQPYAGITIAPTSRPV